MQQPFASKMNSEFKFNVAPQPEPRPLLRGQREPLALTVLQAQRPGVQAVTAGGGLPAASAHARHGLAVDEAHRRSLRHARPRFFVPAAERCFQQQLRLIRAWRPKRVLLARHV